ncbi:MAG: hypothetical protein R3E53_11770 [Myxococcota bacterium]
MKQLSTIPTWFIVAGAKPFGVWQFSQVLLVGRWFVPLPGAWLPS